MESPWPTPTIPAARTTQTNPFPDQPSKSHQTARQDIATSTDCPALLWRYRRGGQIGHTCEHGGKNAQGLHAALHKMNMPHTPWAGLQPRHLTTRQWPDIAPAPANPNLATMYPNRGASPPQHPGQAPPNRPLETPHHQPTALQVWAADCPAKG